LHAVNEELGDDAIPAQETPAQGVTERLVIHLAGREVEESQQGLFTSQRAIPMPELVAMVLHA
jgi:hypothetical protein